MDQFFSEQPCPHCLGSGRLKSPTSVSSTARIVMTNRSWSQRDLALALHVSQSTITHCLLGRRQWPARCLPTLFALANPQLASDYSQ